MRYIRSKLLKHGTAMPLKTHVALPGSTDSERLATMCACTEAVGSGLGAVCLGNDVETHKHTHT